MAEVSLEWREFAEFSAAELYELLRFRQAVFIVEQNCAYEDLDGWDVAARHLLARRDGTLVGCLRLYRGGDRVRIGRVAVAPAARGAGLARRMMRLALAEAAGAPVAISAQTYLRRFYESLGFAAVSAENDDAGLRHIDMALSARAE
jgi:ElaA protein